MNKIILIGCLVQNPKVVASEGKKTAAYFRVAVNRKYGQEGDQNADYFSCVTFGTKAEFLGKYFQKRKKDRFRRRGCIMITIRMTGEKKYME